MEDQQPVEAEKTFDTDYTCEIVCPHCGETKANSWEYEDGEYDCAECGEPFYVSRIIDVTYCTRKA